MNKKILLPLLITVQLANAQQWEAVGSGVYGESSHNGPPTVAAMAFDSLHHLLYVAGIFDSIENEPSKDFAIWTGSRWIAGEGKNYFFNPISALIMYHDTLIHGGAEGLGQWYDTSIVYKPRIKGILGVTCLGIYNDQLYAGGVFGVAYWNGHKWVNITNGINGLTPVEVSALTVYNSQLILGGLFTNIGDTFCHNIAAWDGKT